VLLDRDPLLSVPARSAFITISVSSTSGKSSLAQALSLGNAGWQIVTDVADHDQGVTPPWPSPPWVEAEQLGCSARKALLLRRLLTSDEVCLCQEHFVVPGVAPVPGYAPEQSQGRPLKKSATQFNRRTGFVMCLTGYHS